MAFEFATAQRIVFGRGELKKLPALAAGFGRRALLIAGRHLASSRELAEIQAGLAGAGLAVDSEPASGEPEAEIVDRLAARARACELVIAIGGGSILDLGKAAAGLATNDGPVRDYLEGVGTGRQIARTPLPFIAVPTTAGTGSEATRNAVVCSKKEGFKKSLRSHLLLPSVALVDPALTDSTPPAQTAASGLDALTQLLEPYLSTGATPLTDALSLQGLRLAVEALPRAFRDGGAQKARDDMALASLLGGICLANAGLGAVHGIAAALGACFPIGHGLACAGVLWQTLETNVEALQARMPGHPALSRVARLGEVLAGRTFASEEEARAAAVEKLRSLAGELRVPGLSSFGVSASDVQALVGQSRGSSMKFNPIVLTDEEIGAILRKSL